MPKVKCPIPGCEYETPEYEAPIVAALLNTHAPTHNVVPSTPAKVERVRRPTVTSAGTSEEWTYFESRWNDYKEATKVKDKELIIQLLECCDEDLRKDLTRAQGGSLTEKPEDEVLAAIRQLAVREENTMVAGVTLNNMSQDREETVRAFGTRLRGQARVCKFTLDCHHCNRGVNYTDTVLRDVLIRGLYDQEIQLELLGAVNQNMTLEEVFKFVDAKESAKRSASKLVRSHGAEAASSYRRNKTRSHAKSQEQPKRPDPRDLCSYCGKGGHGVRAPASIRQKECSAYGQTCTKCKRPHHLSSMCRSSSKGQSNEHEGAIFDTLCSTTDYDSCYGDNVLVLDHHIYNDMSDKWTKRASKSQPYIKLTTESSLIDYKVFGYESSFPSKPKKTSVSAMADTGCQSCLAGIKVVNRLGMTEKNL